MRCCEPHMLARTGLTVEDHQRRTVANFIELRERAPELPYIPVLQGWTRTDYERCVTFYEAAGVNLGKETRVRIGSICRRQGTQEVADIVWMLADAGLKIHGFGVKAHGIANLTGALASTDSMAWSYRARRDHPLPRCQHRRCSNCIKYAVRWRDRLLTKVSPQLRLNLQFSPHEVYNECSLTALVSALPVVRHRQGAREEMELPMQTQCSASPCGSMRARRIYSTCGFGLRTEGLARLMGHGAYPRRRARQIMDTADNVIALRSSLAPGFVEGIEVHPPSRVALFTRHTLASYLDLHVNTIDRLVKRGEIPAYRVSGKMRFYPEDVERYIRDHREVV